MKVTYIDHMGSDLSVVNAARVSFGKASKWEKAEVTKGDAGYSGSGSDTVLYTTERLSKADTGLIQFLARGCTSGDWEGLVEEITTKGVNQAYDDFALDPVTEEECEELDGELRELLQHIKNMPTHWTPFGHTAITLHIKAPIFVARQLGKHQVGMVWNEVSRRYIDDTPSFYMPEWRGQAGNVKQGSAGPLNDEQQQDVWFDYQRVVDAAQNAYRNMIDVDGVCPEQARMVLPQSMYTEWYWTGNLYSFANVFIQRSDSHAQREVQEVAKQIGEVIKPLYPTSWEALVNVG